MVLKTTNLNQGPRTDEKEDGVRVGFDEQGKGYLIKPNKVEEVEEVEEKDILDIKEATKQADELLKKVKKRGKK